MAASTDSGFYITPFGMDGEQVGLGFWDASKLSDVWLGVCKEFLNEHGAAFDASWGGNLFEIRTKFTSASGAAIAFTNVPCCGGVPRPTRAGSTCASSIAISIATSATRFV